MYFERFDNVTGERAEAGIAFLVSNENYIKNIPLNSIFK